MEKAEYLEILERRFKKHFRVVFNEKIGDYPIDIKARYEGIYGRTFISKVDIIDQYREREEHYIKYFERPSYSEVRAYVLGMQESILAREIPQNHHRSQFAIVFITDTCDEVIKREIEQYKWHKSHMFGLKGWTDIHMVYVTLDTKEVYTSKKAQPIQKVYAL